MMKIAAISHAYVELFTRVGLLKPGQYPDVETTVVIPKSAVSRSAAGYEKLKGEYRVFPIRTYGNVHQSVRFYSFGLYRLLKQIRPDIIFVNNEPWSSTAFQVVIFSKLLRLKSRIMVYTCENLRRRFPFPFNLLEQYVLKHIDLLITLTKNEGKAVFSERRYGRATAYLPLSVDTDVFRKTPCDRKKYNLFPVNVFLAGFIGRLVPEKGIRLLIESLPALPKEICLLIIGEGPQRQELEALVSVLALNGRVKMIGNVDNRKLADYFNCMDLLILPSLTTKNWKEQFGRVLIEAMACEVPVIGSSSGEIPEVVGEGGLIFRENDAPDLSDKILELFNNPNKRTEYGKRGRERVLARYSRKAVDLATYDIFQGNRNASSH